MEHGAAILLINDDVVDHHQWLGINIQRVQPLYEHHITDTRRTITGYAVNLGTQVLLHLVLDIDGVRVSKILGAIIATHIDLFVIFSCEGHRIEFHLVLFLLVQQSQTYGIEVRHIDID